MNYREAVLFAPADLVQASGTKVIDLDVTQPISRITIRWKTTCATITQSAPKAFDISKIEIVEGSKVLFALSGAECQALAYYSRPGIALSHGQHISTLSETEIFTIDFGRFLWDKLLAFEPIRFTNPQLKITYNEATSDAGATVNELEVLAHLFDKKSISPQGFLSAVEHISYTQGVDGSYEGILLPDDRPIRQMLVRAYLDGYEPWYNIDEVRLDENSLASVPIDVTDMEQYFRRMKSVWPMIILPFQVDMASSAYTYYIPQTNYWANIASHPHGAQGAWYYNAVSARGGKVTVISAAGLGQIGQSFGYLPHHCFQFPLGVQSDPDDWYDPTGLKPRLRVKSHTGGASSTVQVILEQLYKY